MLLVALILVPALAALGAALQARRAGRLAWVLAGTALHAALLVATWVTGPPAAPGGWLAFDPLGGLVLSLVSLLTVGVATYTVAFVRPGDPRAGRAFESCLLAFLAAASLVAVSHHLGLLWVGIEATTLATAPLIYHRDDPHSLEAVWKYLVVCSVGIALALLGTFFLATAQVAGGVAGRPLVLDDLMRHGAGLHGAWVRAAFLFLAVGFGTKMGLAPLHTWLPDAHGEAPAPVSALLSGALLNCAFLGVLRAFQVANAAGEADFARPVLLGLGLVSLAVAAVFVVRQDNYKRLLAYSSVEHMGILALGSGMGGLAMYGSLLHMLGSSIAKAVLFLLAGNILAVYGSKLVQDVQGVVRRLPVSGVLFLLAFLAITGSPPFVPFMSELAILTGAFKSGHAVVAVAMLALQAVVFIGMGSAFLGMSLGASPERGPPIRERAWQVAAPAVLMTVLLVLGLHIPAALQRALAAAAGSLGGVGP